MARALQTARDFLLGVRDELRKVTWPDRPQLRNATGVVLAFTFAMAAVVFVIDVVLAKALDVLRGVFGG